MTEGPHPYTFASLRIHISSTLGDKMEKGSNTNQNTQLGDSSETRAYQKPSIRVMDEKEVLSAFQVTVAGTTWWVA